jgi:hypothetical protein
MRVFGLLIEGHEEDTASVRERLPSPSTIFRYHPPGLLRLVAELPSTIPPRCRRASASVHAWCSASWGHEAGLVLLTGSPGERSLARSATGCSNTP